MPQAKIKTAIIIGEHPFDSVPAFHELWRNMPDVDPMFRTIVQRGIQWLAASR